MKKTILSIVVPVYKVEAYLERCVVSIIDNMPEECELILVDDGSPDNCGALCDAYSKQYSKVSCVHKENGGLSDARNVGIDNSCGEYIWFIDSDDYIAKGAVKRIIDLIKRNPCDVLVCQSKVVNDCGVSKNERCYNIPIRMYSSNSYMSELRKHPESVLFCAQYHICNRAFINKNNFRFYKGILHEDELWTPQLLLNAEKIYYSGENIYYHFMREGSIMHSSNMEASGRSDMLISENLLQIFNKSGRKDLQYLRDHMVDTYLQAVWKVPDFIYVTPWKRIEPLKNAFFFKTKLKSLLYFLSPKLYLHIHNSVK